MMNLIYKIQEDTIKEKDIQEIKEIKEIKGIIMNEEINIDQLEKYSLENNLKYKKINKRNKKRIDQKNSDINVFELKNLDSQG